MEARGFTQGTTEFLEEYLSAEEGFAGKPRETLTAKEAEVLFAGGTDQEQGPYGGNKFLPTRGYFACKSCGAALFLPIAKFVH